MPEKSPIKYAFFGSSRFSVIVLDELERLGFLPTCVVTMPDKPQGRGLTVLPNVVRSWADERGIKAFVPEKIDQNFVANLAAENCNVFVVASYGKILPRELIDLPPRKTLNIHPSLLPKYRGSTPLQTAMIDDAKESGVTIMQIDELVDHGPIVAQKKIAIAEWPTYEDFEEMMARAGAQLLAETLPKWVAREIQEHEQDHGAATLTKRIAKEDGCLDLSTDPYLNFRKIQAFHQWPKAYFILEHKGRDLRVKISEAAFEKGALVIKKVIPEGSREMSYGDFLKGYGTSY